MRMPLTTLATLLLLGTGAVAQTTAAPATDAQPTAPSTATPAPAPGVPHAATTGTVGDAKLEKGANSFTEGQVRSRLDQAGLRDVHGLKKDQDGIWRGQATRDGKSVVVGFDFKGNLAVR